MVFSGKEKDISDLTQRVKQEVRFPFLSHQRESQELNLFHCLGALVGCCLNTWKLNKGKLESLVIKF